MFSRIAETSTRTQGGALDDEPAATESHYKAQRPLWVTRPRGGPQCSSRRVSRFNELLNENTEGLLPEISGSPNEMDSKHQSGEQQSFNVIRQLFADKESL